MSNFSILLKNEFKTNFKNKTKSGISNTIIEVVLSLGFLVVVALLALNIVDTYIHIKYDKVYDISSRLKEVLNIINIVMLVFLFIYSIEKERKMILYSPDKKLLLRLPVKSSHIFLSKICVIFIFNYIISFIVYLTIGILLTILLDANVIIILLTLLTSLVITFLSLFVSTILLVPYAKIINFIKKCPFIALILLVFIVSLFIYLYLLFLNILQVFIETGSIRHLFNEQFINNMMNIFKYSYFINIFSTLIVNPNINNLLVSVSSIVVLGLLIFFVSKLIFYKSLYLSPKETRLRKNNTLIKHSPLFAMLKKELISIYRNPKQLFLYFVIPLVLPILIIGTSNIFIKLVSNALGIYIDFEILLLVSLLFISLINSFSGNLISKDGLSFLKYKTYPLNTNKILLSKIIFNLILSALSVIITFILSFTILKINIIDSILLFVILLIFTVSQILLGLKLDLNHSKVSDNNLVNSVNTANNQNKLILIFVLMSFIFGITPLIISICVKLYSLNINYLVYLLPFTFVVISFIVSICYYKHRINECFTNYDCKE